MKLTKYNKYKPSGIEWLGDIPEQWEVRRIKDFTYVKGRIGWQGLRSDEFVDNTEWYCVTGTDFKDGEIDWSNCYCVVQERFDQDKKIQLKIDDLLITKDGSIGKIALLKSLPKKATLNSGVFVTRSRKNAYLNKFMFWQLEATVFKNFIDYTKNGSTIMHLYQNVFERFFYNLPDLKTQSDISIYLNRQTVTIVKKISLLEKKVQYYQELRKSLIKEAVCRGLNKKTKLKDSGIEWIGKIPEHWEVKRIKDIVKKSGSGGTPNTGISEYYENGTINWVNTGDLNDGILYSCQKKITKLAIKENSTLKTYDEDTLVIAMYGATIGKLAILAFKATTNQACCCLTFNKKAINKFLFYWFLSEKENIISLSYGGTQPNISQGTINYLILGIPPISEQTDIIKYLDQKTSKVDIIINNIKSQIEKLKELRKTLINDVVTGKIKVNEN